MRLSAQTRSHRAQASAMLLASFPIICSVVRSLRTVIWVKRQKKNRSWPACSNQSRAFSECICRPHRRASQTLASRKFNVFIDLFVGYAHLGALGNNKGEPDFAGA